MTYFGQHKLCWLDNTDVSIKHKTTEHETKHRNIHEIDTNRTHPSDINSCSCITTWPVTLCRVYLIRSLFWLCYSSRFSLNMHVFIRHFYRNVTLKRNVHNCSRAQLLRIRASDSWLTLEDTGSNPVLPCYNLGQVFHYTLLQFTQLYKRIPGYRQWWIRVRAHFAH